MQNKGAIKFFAIAFALVSLFQLSFTFFTRKVEKDAEKYANNNQAKILAEQYAKKNPGREMFFMDSIVKSRKRFYLDSIANKPVYNILLRKYTYQECKEREINLGLDLKGGMNVMLEVSVKDIIIALSNYSKDPTFRKAIEMASEKQKDSQSSYLSLFMESFEELDPNAKLAAIFNTVELKDRISYNSTNSDVYNVLKTEVGNAFDRTLNILRTRIDRYGVAQPNIQPIASTGRIMVELPGVKDPERVRKLLQGTAELEFWETYKFNEIADFFATANQKLSKNQSNVEGKETDKKEADKKEEAKKEEKADKDSASDEVDELLEADSLKAKQKDTFDEYAKENPLFAYLQPAYIQAENGGYYPAQSATVGYAKIQDTARINGMISKVKNVFPRNLKLAWMVKPRQEGTDVLELMALKVTSRDGRPALSGDAITNARQDYSQNGEVNISMSMNSEGARIWKRLTGENIGRQVAIVLDNYVYSAPNVNDEIPSGRSEISGNFTIKEAKDLANILEAGKLPAPANIVQEEVVGPSLGKAAIRAGLISFIIAFILVLIFMIFYYRKAGWVANLALVANMFFIMGVLASLGAVLTLPGIAGIVLTIGMAVDANVIIYERIKEEVRAGKGIRLAINDGYKNAYSAIIDGNITTLLTGIVLYVFGSGPVQGFATTLIIGILSSLFTAILISRVIFSWMLDKNKKVNFGSKLTLNAFTNINIDYVGKRKLFYVISGIVVLAGIISLATKGLNKGVDFAGGRTFVVRFDKDADLSKIRKDLTAVFEGETPEVKTLGSDRQVKITTEYLIDENTAEADSIVESRLYQGLANKFENKISRKEFLSDTEEKLIGKLSSQKVGPTIADDLVQKSFFAVLFALVIIFLYIALRFRKWQFGLSGVATLAHDSIIALSVYSIGYGLLPFNLEIDQSTIAAILTIIGYSINDTVIIFDRIREYINLHPKRTLKDNMNSAVNSTLGRTFMTSGTTLLVLIAIFLFGGEIIRGFIFALIVGVLVGTYSSVFISTPIVYELTNKQKSETLGKKTKKN